MIYEGQVNTRARKLGLGLFVDNSAIRLAYDDVWSRARAKLTFLRRGLNGKGLSTSRMEACNGVDDGFSIRDGDQLRSVEIRCEEDCVGFENWQKDIGVTSFLPI